jgi:S-layer protein (TIGR01567 family)
MDHVRVGGVCLLIIIIAAALPIGSLAQLSQATTDSGVKASEKAAGGAIPALSEKLLSKSSGEGETVSTQKLIERNSGLKPLKSSQGDANSGGTKTAQSGQSNAASTIKSEASQATASSVAASATAASAQQNTPTQSQTASQSQTATQVQKEPSETASVPANKSEAVNSTQTQKENNTAEKNVSSEASTNESAKSSQEATSENAIETGTDRIWRQGISPDEYTWTPQSFSGFFYDMDDNVGTENLLVKLQKSGNGYSRSIDSGNLRYKSDVQDIQYKYNDWGSYQVMGFMADKYFAGYKENEVIDNPRSLINEGQLRKVLIDSDTENTLTSGSVMPLEEGYELRIKEVDINGNKIYLSLAKNGEEIDSKVVSPDNPKSATYQYKIDVAGQKTPIIMAHISNVFASTESNLATIDGLFQISDTYASVEDGDKYEKMKVVSVSDQGVEMENEDSLTLRKGGTAKIFGDVGFEVADADELRFAPIVQRTGTYEVRGTVINPADTKEFAWTPYNFEGFYYDIDDDVGTETLDASITKGTSIDEKDLVYKTSPQPVKFKFNPWGKYDVIGFMADKYFAGYNNQTKFTDEVSIINEGQLRKVLTDSDDSRTIASGSVLPLEEGYELRIKQVDLNGNKVFLSLAKNGEEVDSKVVTPSGDAEDKSSNYMYKINAGSAKDVPIIIAHIQSVFRGTETDLATVDGLFQVSDSAEAVEEGEVHGKMKVETLDDNGITMKNEGTISLGRGRTIDVMDNLKLVVADSTDRLIAPIATKTSEGNSLNLTVNDAVINEATKFTVRSRAKFLSGVQVLVNRSNIGVTDSSGSVTYTPKSTGLFDVLARKSGYNDAKATFRVRTALEASALVALKESNVSLANALSINMPSEVGRGEDFLITVKQGIDQNQSEGAKILLDGKSIGNTSAQGTLVHRINASGDHTVTVEKEGFNETSKKISVISPIKLQSIKVPDKAAAGQDIKITANLQNTGKETEVRKLELKVNDKVVDSKNVTVKAGENYTASFSYKPKEPGSYRISLDGQSKTVNADKAQNRNWLIAVILILLIAIGAGYYLYSTGDLDKLKEKYKGR